METLIVEADIKVLCVTAKSFPDGIKEAFDKLHACVPQNRRGRLFGISRPNGKGEIIYKAAMEELYEGDAQKYECELCVIKSGKYIYLDRTDYEKDSEGIGKAFQVLVSHPNIDPSGYCLEWYMNERDVRCMVRLKN
jgi:hypothetical protein